MSGKVRTKLLKECFKKGRKIPAYFIGFYILVGFIFLTFSTGWAQTPPTLSSITPDSEFWETSNLTVTVQGSNFVTGSRVEFTCDPCTAPGISVVSTQFNSVTMLVAVIDIAKQAEAATWQVEVVNPDDSRSNARLFTVNERILVVDSSTGDLTIEAGSPLRYSRIVVKEQDLTIRGVSVQIDTILNLGVLFDPDYGVGGGRLIMERGARLFPPPDIYAFFGLIYADSQRGRGSLTLDGKTITLDNTRIYADQVTISADNLIMDNVSSGPPFNFSPFYTPTINVDSGGEKGGYGCNEPIVGSGEEPYMPAGGDGAGGDGNGGDCPSFGSSVPREPGGGGGHGGPGGRGDEGGFNVPGGTTYGNPFAPTDKGSGGGKATGIVSDFFFQVISVEGGSGGGTVRIEASDVFRNNGIITANGGNGLSTEPGSGGGSGGSIYIISDVLEGDGTGIFSANGGNGGNSQGGGGGGGRIALYYNTDNTSAPYTSVSCNPGMGGSTSGEAGGVGTCNSPIGGIIQKGADPVISTVFPSSLGQGASNQTLTISGFNIRDGATAFFDGNDITVNSATFDSTFNTLSVNVTLLPTATLGSRIVTLKNADGTMGTNPSVFSVNPGPTFDSIIPSRMDQGENNPNVEINGSNFEINPTLSFSGTGITVNSVSYVSSTELRADISVAPDASVSQRDVIVENPDKGRAVGSNRFRVELAPKLNSVSPANLEQGAFNETLRLEGSGFSSGATVSFSGSGDITTGLVTVADDKTITLPVTVLDSAALGPRDVTVTIPVLNENPKIVTCSGCLDITAGSTTPQLDSVAPSNIFPGTTGQMLSLRGSGFATDATVDFSCDTTVIPGCTNGISVGTVSFQNSTDLRVSIDVLSTATYGVRTVTINNPGGGSSASTNLLQVGGAGAMSVYGEQDVSDPRVRIWNGTVWSGEHSAVGQGGVATWQVLRSNPIRDEKVLATLDGQDKLIVQVWNGNQWGNSLNLTPTSESGITTVESRSFDVAYDASGNAMVVFGLSGAEAPKYRIWDGTSWGPENGVPVTPTAGSGVPVWIRLAPKPIGQEIILVFKDSQRFIKTLVWDGTQFINEQLLTAEGTFTITPGLEVAYEVSSGEAMVVWSKNNSATPWYRIWDGTNWLAEGQGIQFGVSSNANLRHLRLVGDPQSDQMALGVGDENGEIQVQFWDGSNWMNTGTRTPFTLTENIGSIPQEMGVGRNFDLAWESKNPQLIIAYGDGGIIGGKYRKWTLGSGWSSSAALPSGPRIPDVVQLRSNPTNNEILMTLIDRKINESDTVLAQGITSHRWTGFVWDSATVLEPKPPHPREVYDSKIGNNVVVRAESAMIAFSQHQTQTALTISGMTPSLLGEGTSTPVTLSGTGFVTGSTVTFSGTGVTSGGIPTANGAGTQLSFTVDVAGGAVTGARDITVTNPNGQSVTASGVLTVGGLSTSSPALSQIFPSSLPQGASLAVVSLQGSDFQNDAAVDVVCNILSCTNGVAVSSVVFVNSSRLDVTMSVTSTATAGARDITVTNPDSGSTSGLSVLEIQTMSGLDLDVSTLNLILNKDATYRNIIVRDGRTLTLQGDITLTATGDICVAGTISVCAPGSTGAGTILVSPASNFVTIKADNINVESGGKISSDEQGCAPAAGCGPNGLGAGESSATGGAGGASHGGAGGHSGGSLQINIPIPFGGSGSLITYGETDFPTSRGSGGGNGDIPNSGGSGGGAIKIEVYDTLTLDGQITAEGGNGFDSTVSSGGGGSGGALQIIADTISSDGSGVKLSVKGGNGGTDGIGGFDINSDFYFNDGGGGGGGLIAVYSAITSNFSSAQLNCAGGLGGLGGAMIGTNGQAGICRLSVQPPPEVNSVSPSSIEAGVTDQNITIIGSNFVVGATVTLGPDIGVNSSQLINSKQIEVNVHVSPAAVIGPRDVIVSNPIVGQFASGNNLLTVLDPNESEPPRAVTDLAIDAGKTLTTSSVPLTWTAPADIFNDGSTGPVAEYDLRFATVPISESNFGSTSPFIIGQAPRAPEVAEQIEVSGLIGGRTYYFALKSKDANGNISPISNIISVDLTEDVTSPEAITDLSGDVVSSNSINLSWASPGDDGFMGQANHYIVKISLTNIFTQFDFDKATTYPQFLIPKESVIPHPKPKNESLLISGLSSNTRYYIAIEAVDEVGNRAPLSNVLSAVTQGSGLIGADSLPPAAINDLEVVPSETRDTTLMLRWTATGDDGSSGTAAGYDLRYSSLEIVDSGGDGVRTINFSNANQAVFLPAPQEAGNIETVLISGLTPNTPYFLAVKAFDSGYNPNDPSSQGISDLSNVVSTRTALRRGFNLVSVPLIPDPSDVASVFGDEAGLPLDRNVLIFDSVGTDPSDGEFKFPTDVKAGTGYFLYSEVNIFVLDGPAGSQPVSSSTSVLQLKRGWNIIGNPYDRRVEMQEIMVRQGNGTPIPFSSAVSNRWVGNAIYTYNGSNYIPLVFNDPSPAALEPWKGYWLHVPDPDPNVTYYLEITRP